MEHDELKQLILGALDDLKAQDVTSIYIGDVTSVADWMVIASGTSSRHVKSLANNVALEAKKAGEAALGLEGEEEGEWVLIDFADVVVHVMLSDTRKFYDLESLWKIRPSSADADNAELE